MSDADRASFAALSDEFGALARTVDPDDPWSYVCGSDQWVCGYMEGAVRTGRRAAAAALGTYVR